MSDILKLFLEASIMASVMVAVVLLMRAIMAKRLRPSVMLMLWGMVLLRLCLPFTLSSPVNLITVPWQNTSLNAVYDTPPTSQTTSGFSNASDINTENTYTQAANETVSQTAANANATPSAISAGQRISVSLWDILSAVWIAGAALTLLLFAAKARRFTKSLKLCRPVTDADVLDIIRHHKEAAGIKTDIAVLECPFAYSPMVAGCFRPRIILLTKFMSMGREALGAILLHEVCHIRRRDILKNYIWLAAKAVHWFNPLVWLAYKYYEDDVELCRDNDAARMLESDGGIVYSMSLLEAARLAGSAESAPPPAAALFENRCSLKTRIQRLIRPRRNAAFYAAVSVLLALVMAVTCFTTACQPTPVTPPVAGKNVDLVKLVTDANRPGNKAELDNDKKSIEEQIRKLGGRLEMQMQPSENVTINVNADIVSRGYNKLPLVRVRPKNFTKEQFEAFAKYVTKGQQLYMMDPDAGLMTKEEIEDILPRIKAQLESGTLPDDAKESWEFMVDQLNMDHENAINKADEKPYDGKLREIGDNGRYSTITHLKCYMGKDRAAWLDMYQSFNNVSSQMTFNNTDYAFGYNTFELYEGNDAERLNITYDEARAMAEEFVRTLDGEDTNLAIVYSNIGYCLGAISNYTKETSPQSYMFSFSRCYNGAEVKSVLYLLGMKHESEYGEQGGEIDYDKQVSPEGLTVVIDDGGICQAYWLNHTEYIETVADDMPLLDFDTIKGIFENFCKYRFAWAPPFDGMPKDLSVTFNVKRVELNLMTIPEKDNLENYITVPVWDFIADQEYEEGAAYEDGTPINGDKGISILTINAINGSIVNREQGY